MRMDPPRAIKASAYQLARIICSSVTGKQQFKEQLLIHSEEYSKFIKKQRIIQQAERLGLRLVEDDADVVVPKQTIV